MRHTNRQKSKSSQTNKQTGLSFKRHIQVTDKPLSGRQYQHFMDGRLAYSVLTARELEALEKMVSQGHAFGSDYLYHFSDKWAYRLCAVMAMEGIHAKAPLDFLARALLHLEPGNLLTSHVILSHAMTICGVSSSDALAFGRDHLNGGDQNKYYEPWKQIVSGTEGAILKLRAEELEALLPVKSDSGSRVKI